MWPERVSFISFYVGPTPCHLSNSYLQRNQFVQLRKSLNLGFLISLVIELLFSHFPFDVSFLFLLWVLGSIMTKGQHLMVAHVNATISILITNDFIPTDTAILKWPILFLNTNSFSSRSLFEPTNQSHCAGQWLCFRTVLFLHSKSESYFYIKNLLL